MDADSGAASIDSLQRFWIDRVRGVWADEDLERTCFMLFFCPLFDGEQPLIRFLPAVDGDGFLKDRSADPLVLKRRTGEWPVGVFSCQGYAGSTILPRRQFGPLLCFLFGGLPVQPHQLSDPVPKRLRRNSVLQPSIFQMRVGVYKCRRQDVAVRYSRVGPHLLNCALLNDNFQAELELSSDDDTVGAQDHRSTAQALSSASKLSDLACKSPNSVLYR